MFQCVPELHADGCEGGKAANERKDEVAEGEICNQEKSWTLGFTFKMIVFPLTFCISLNIPWVFDNQ